MFYPELELDILQKQYCFMYLHRTLVHITLNIFCTLTLILHWNFLVRISAGKCFFTK